LSDTSNRHRTHRVGWLRAAVLGANDGIVSTASLVLGVAAPPAREHAELADIYVRRGLDADLASIVASQLRHK
jgi:VIT1/CCC1 family predicted Fe2+/Mn2+ transporter